MKTAQELVDLAQRLNYISDLSLNYTVGQDQDGCLLIEAYRVKDRDNKKVRLSPWGETLDHRELWRYEENYEPNGGHPVATLDPTFIVALFE